MMYLGDRAVGIMQSTESFEEISKKTIALQLLCEENTLPETIVIDCSKLRYLGFPTDWNINSGLKHVILKNLKQIETGSIGLPSAEGITRISLEPNHGIESIDFGTNCLVSGQLNKFFNYWYELKYIYGSLNFSNVTAWTYSNWFIGNSLLEKITFIPNSAVNVQTLIFDNLSNINDESLISIGNLCLANPSDSRTLKLHATKKNRCATLMGKNENGLFVADENGTLSLHDFITTVKGWAIA